MEIKLDARNPEVLLVAGSLVRPELISEAAPYVRKEDFEDSRLHALWAGVNALLEAGAKADDIDIVAVSKKGAKTPDEQRELAIFASSLLDLLPKPKTLVVAAQRVHRKATLRFALNGMRNVAIQLKDEIDSNDGDMPELDQMLANLSIAVSSRSDLNTNRTDYVDHASEVGHYIESIYNNDTKLYIATGIPKLDRYLGGGLRPGQLHVIHGGTGAGKTALASQMADNAAQHGRRTLFFSMEVDPLDIYIRDTERMAGVSRWDLRDFAKRDDAVLKLSEAHAKLIALEKSKQKIVYGEPISIDGIRQAILTERIRVGKVDLVVVDHAQVAKPSESERRGMPRYLEVKNTAEGLRAIARQLKVAVLLTAQLNPPAKGEEASMNNVRESKDINNAAEVVIVIHHVKEEDFAGDMTIQESYLKIEKARAGQEGRIKVKYNGKIFRFEEEYAAHQEAKQVVATPEPDETDD